LLSKQEEGREGEERAEKTLKKEGYTIIEKNYRTRFGEIDIIAEEKGHQYAETAALDQICVVLYEEP
jgi:Holliday junction resolvase-like predicted endonuclease